MQLQNAWTLLWSPVVDWISLFFVLFFFFVVLKITFVFLGTCMATIIVLVCNVMLYGN